MATKVTKGGGDPPEPNASAFAGRLTFTQPSAHAERVWRGAIGYAVTDSMGSNTSSQEEVDTEHLLMALLQEAERATDYNGFATVLLNLPLEQASQMAIRLRTSGEVRRLDYLTTASIDSILQRAESASQSAGRTDLKVRDLLAGFFFAPNFEEFSVFPKLVNAEALAEIRQRLAARLSSAEPGDRRIAEQFAPASTVPSTDEPEPLPFFLSDVAIGGDSEDALNYAAMADAMRDLLLNPETRTPLVLAINAQWGAGKTSLANLVRRRVEERSAREMLFAWLNARVFSGKATAVAPPGRGLIQRLLKEIENARPSSHDYRHAVCWFNAWHHDDSPKMLGAFARAAGRELGPASVVAGFAAHERQRLATDRQRDSGRSVRRADLLRGRGDQHLVRLE